MGFITQNLDTGENNLLSQGLCWIARDRSQENCPVGIIACDDPVAGGELQITEGLPGEDKEKISVVTGLLEEVSRPMQEIFGQGKAYASIWVRWASSPNMWVWVLQPAFWRLLFRKP